MPKATDSYNLAVANPSLAREWHPTRNAELTPRSVTPGSGKKIWWICSKGHEWQAAVYSRSRGSNCPICSKSSTADNNKMLISNTDLIRQWHLTKNSGLNLRNLPPGFKQKVWWICQEGHEWEDTVTARMQGRGCPHCQKSAARKETYGRTKGQQLGKIFAAQQSDSAGPSFSQTSGASGFRKNKRYLHRATVIIEDMNSGSLSYAQTKDFSNDGMLLESAVAFKPGTKIKVKFDTQPFKSAPKSYSSVVKWCKEVGDENTVHLYGIGVKFT